MIVVDNGTFSYTEHGKCIKYILIYSTHSLESRLEVIQGHTF